MSSPDENSRFIELKAQGRLPSIKGVALSILESTANEDASLGRIAQIVTPDPALTARLIKISNSALYPGSRPVASLQDAIAKLGLSQVRQIALGFALVSENREGACPEFDYPSFWARSILRGSLMRQTALSLKFGSPEEMFTLGLLGKIGELALATAYPEKYSSLLESREEGASLRAKERQMFGIDAPTLSSALMEDWRLPPAFGRAARMESSYQEAEDPKIKGLFTLIKGAEGVAQGWVERQDATPEKRLEELIEPTQETLNAMLRASESYQGVGREESKELAKASFEEGVSWLESLAILPRLKAKKPRSSQPKTTPAPVERARPTAPRRALAEELMDPRGSGEAIRALVGCSDAASIKTIAQALSMRSGQIMALRSKDELFEELLEFAPHLLFLDFDPSPSFPTLLESIRETELGKGLLVVLICKPEHEAKVGVALSSGADDYVTRPFGLAQACAKVATAERLAEVSHSMRESREAIKRYALELESVNKKLLQTALSDTLTGLPNRLLFQDRLKQAAATTLALKNGDKTALLILDLDHFKNINDAFGHPAGDEMLRSMAERVKPLMKVTDSLARLGGDEFAIILREIKSEAEAEAFAKRVLEKIGAPSRVHERETRVTGSIGIALCPDHGSDAHTLIKHADLALYKAKESGRGRSSVFTSSLSEALTKRFSIESALNQALERGEFELYFQPRVDLVSHRMGGAEALLRWKNPEMGFIPPDVFIPIAEETGAIEIIGEWVMKEALRLAKPWLALDPSFHVAVNLSARQFKARDLPTMIAKALADEGFPARNLEIEVTESAAMDDIFFAARALEELKRIGLLVSLDDFGTGYSSLAYLKKLPFDILKIDKSFIINALTDKDDAAISRMIAALAKTMGKGLVAEGVETAAHAVFAQTLGARWAQGFLYSKPVPAEELKALFGKTW